MESRGDAAGVTAVLAVLVVYRLLPRESPSLQTLLRASAEAAAAELPLRLSIVVVDNTPGGQDPGVLPPGVRYEASPDNPGLARPYNEALAAAAREGCEWLLTLDQDTHLPENFLIAMEGYARRYRGCPEIGAIVPRVADHGRLISPFCFAGGFWPRVLPPAAEGVAPRFTSAINSASLLRVEAARAIGGYDPRFPLNNSDTSLFHRLDQAGKRVAIAGGVRVEHELAILDREGRMTADRYRQLLRDECSFYDRHMPLPARGERLLRLIVRAVGSLLRGREPEFRRIAMAEIARRLLTRRSSRLRMDQGVRPQ